MNSWYIYGCWAVLFVLIACQQDQIRTSSVSGYSYEVYRDEPGSHPDVGDQVYFEMDILDDQGKLLQSYRNQKQMPSIRVTDPTDVARLQNPIVDIISHLSVGDSIGIIVPKDSVPGLPPEYDYVNNLLYGITVKEILSQEDYTARLDEEKKRSEIQAQAVKDRLPEVETLAKNTLEAYKSERLELESTGEGVRYVIHERGEGDLPTNDRMVTVQYYGSLVEDGSNFDNSFRTGRGISFRLGRGEVIPGWDLTIPYLPVGTKASLFVPGHLAYGEMGFGEAIPPNSDLYFYVEIEELFY